MGSLANVPVTMGTESLGRFVSLVAAAGGGLLEPAEVFFSGCGGVGMARSPGVNSGRLCRGPRVSANPMLFPDAYLPSLRVCHRDLRNGRRGDSRRRSVLVQRFSHPSRLQTKTRYQP